MEVIRGNPRALIELKIGYYWDIKRYLAKTIDQMSVIFRKITVEQNKRINEIFNEIKDYLYELEDLDLSSIWRNLLENNIVIYTDARFKRLSKLEESPWISERCSFQIPMFYWIIKTMVEHNTLKVRPEHVIKQISQ